MTEEQKSKEKSNFKLNKIKIMYFPASAFSQIKPLEFEIVYTKLSQTLFSYMKLISFLHS